MQTTKPHLPYVDCLRGYAILMVITCHLSYEIHDLPFPLARITHSGWDGVQLFFLMSAFTLLNSWRGEAKKYGTPSTVGFFIRRYLRIAPAYYLAALIYYFVQPPKPFDAVQLFGTLFFINGWSPNLMPTVLTKWMVVPGEWSIGVEFSFYVLFPVLATVVTSLRRALIAVIAGIAVGLGCNLILHSFLASSVPNVPLSNFLYFWLPDQAPVFLLGFLLYYLSIGTSTFSERVMATITKIRWPLIAISVCLFLSTTFLPLAHYIGQPTGIPETLLVGIVMFGFALGVGSASTFLVNIPVKEMGKVSFSAYLLHFAVLDLVRRFPETFGLHTGGFKALVWFSADWVFVVLVTFAVSALQYKLVEFPMMELAKRLTKHHRSSRVAVTAH